MKNNGLRNRFPPEVRLVWLYWYSCMFCGENQQDVLHHIISPSVRHYIDGKHNESVFNSCPIHNYGCHIGNEAWLGHNVDKLVNKVAEALLFDIGYEIKPIDMAFLKTYKHLYCPHVLKKAGLV